MFLGIDFGTTFSQISTMYLGQPLLLLNPGEYGIPSAFYYDGESGILTGQDALDAGLGDAACNLVREIKMSIISVNDIILDGKRFTPQEIAGHIYRTLIAKASQVARKKAINTDIEGVVLTVPARFGIQEKNAIYEAAKGCMGSRTLPVKAIIKEPVAAAIAYHSANRKDGENILVFDLGGGTCDIALVRADSGRREKYVVVDDDMVRIGGRDWDAVLEEYITQIIENKSGISIRGSAGYEEKIRRAAVSVKHELSDSSRERATARVELGGRIYSAPVTRKAFDEITAHLLKEALDCLEAVYDRNCRTCGITEIICAGGSSNMLQVEEGLLRRFPGLKIRIFEPEHAVINGAAIYADSETGTLRDIASFSYGIKVLRDYENDPDACNVSNILLRGSRLPASHTGNYCPPEDDMEMIAFRIYESSYDEEEYGFERPDKRFVGILRLNLPPESPKTLTLQCRLTLNSDGLLEAEASEPSGNKVSAEFILDEI